MKLKQISIFLENSPGRLQETTRALGDAGINLRALTLSEAADYGVLRLLVSNIDKARQITTEHFRAIKMDELLSMNRTNGFYQMIEMMQMRLPAA